MLNINIFSRETKNIFPKSISSLLSEYDENLCKRHFTAAKMLSF